CQHMRRRHDRPGDRYGRHGPLLDGQLREDAHDGQGSTKLYERDESAAVHHQPDAHHCVQWRQVCAVRSQPSELLLGLEHASTPPPREALVRPGSVETTGGRGWGNLPRPPESTSRRRYQRALTRRGCQSPSRCASTISESAKSFTSSIPATKPPMCAQNATPPPSLAMRPNRPLTNCSPNQ